MAKKKKEGVIEGKMRLQKDAIKSRDIVNKEDIRTSDGVPILDGDVVEGRGFLGKCSVHKPGECGAIAVVGRVGQKYGFSTWTVLSASVPKKSEDHFVVGSTYFLKPDTWKLLRKLSKEEVVAVVL